MKAATFARLKKSVLILLVVAMTSNALLPTAYGVLPPKPLQELYGDAQHVFVGKVTSVRFVEHYAGNRLFDREWFIEMEVLSQEKGEDVGRVATVTTWQMAARENFVGPQGQDWIPSKGDLVKVFTQGEVSILHGDHHDKGYAALEPNGIVPHHVGPPAAMPPEYVGVWTHQTREGMSKITRTVRIHRDGAVAMTYRKDSPFGRSSSQGTENANWNGERLVLKFGGDFRINCNGHLVWTDFQGEQTVFHRCRCHD